MNDLNQRPRGAIPTPRHKLAGAMPHRVVGDTPSQYITIPKRLSYWLNNQYGDCVTAEEAFAKACYSPEIFIQDGTVMSFASKHNLLNGAELLGVIHLMQSEGFHQDGEVYTDGSATAIDYTDSASLRNAISLGPVKIGVAAAQLEHVVTPSNGWFATGFRPDRNMDHCVSLCGYGTISWLAQQLGVSVPSHVEGTQPGYAMFTWNTIGIISLSSLLAITGEAWLRTPTTIANPPLPSPTPTPTPIPVPPVPPVPPPVPPPIPSTISTVGDLVAVLGQYPATDKVVVSYPLAYRSPVVTVNGAEVVISGGHKV